MAKNDKRKGKTAPDDTSDQLATDQAEAGTGSNGGGDRESAGAGAGASDAAASEQAAGGDGQGQVSEQAQPAAGAAAAASEPAALAAQVAELQQELLRKRADFDNFRKRLNRDKEEAIKFANNSLLLDLTAVIDDFERAIAAAEQTEDFKTLHSGVELIEKQLLGTLERKWGLTRFDSAGEPFDPERHEAIATEQSAEHSRDTVLETYQRGYTLHGRVVRPARVRVAQPAAPAPDEPAESPQTNPGTGA